ncbi:hypothetical protein ACIP6Q_23895 [Streptomyces bobili]|uniref:hypothetical protein n=1 Tax=Streptomyces bobili TaxID=67280 RepID=UPI00381A3161
MSPPGRRYGYVGPPELRQAVVAGTEGQVIRRAADLDAWTAAAGQDGEETFTFVVGPDGLLRLAPRRSEHVACAGGGEVLGAGEVTLRRTGGGWRADQVSNQSTGYCPDPDSWPAVAAALDRAGIARPRGVHARAGVPPLRALSGEQRGPRGRLRLRVLRRGSSRGMEPRRVSFLGSSP